MPSVPEFLLRKLYVPASLKSLEDGFSFQLNNTLMTVSIAGLGIKADEKGIPVSCLSLQFAGEEERSAKEIKRTTPVILTLNRPLTVRVKTALNHPNKLQIEAQTIEMGILSFSIDLHPKKENWFFTCAKRTTGTIRSTLQIQKVRHDPHHPIYHFTPPANWMNDPNGLVNWQGKTHLFYQYNPQAPVWGTPCWGHAVSTDLVHWQRLPIALRPHPGQADQDGCWSGSAAITEDGPLFFYTGVFPETVCLAKPDTEFEKLELQEGNPVISAPPEGLTVEGFRDPNIWKEGDHWYLTLGTGIKGTGGAVLLYESTDMHKWNYLHPLLQGDSRRTDPFPTGTMWECPQLFELDGEYFLFISGCVIPGLQYTFYFQGKMQSHHLAPYTLKHLDYGCKVFYAPLSFLDEKGRRVMFGWLVEERDEAANRKAGWAGVMSLPRLLTLSPQKELQVDPLPEIETLRQKLVNSYEGKITSIPLEIGAGKQILNAEIISEMISTAGGKAIFLLAETFDAGEKTIIAYDFNRSLLSVDTRDTNCDSSYHGELKEAPLILRAGEMLELRIFVDGSVLEVYANHRMVISSRFYPERANRLRLFVRSDGAIIQVKSLKLWSMGHF